MLHLVVALFVDNIYYKKSNNIVLCNCFVYFSNYYLSIILSDYLHCLSIVLIKLVIIVYLLHLLTRIETRKYIEIVRLLSKSHIFSLLFLTIFANYLYCLSIILIKLLIIVYILYLLTRIETRRYVEIARLLSKSYIFSSLFLIIFANYLYYLFTILIKLLIIVYLLHLLTRIETRRYIKIVCLLSKLYIFSSLFLVVFANYLHYLSIISIKLVIIVYILYLLTRIETKKIYRNNASII